MIGKRFRWLLFLSASFVAGAGLIWLYYQWNYPYGWSHCCDKQLENALNNYAHDHNGVFPSGGSTAEASLSHLYPKYADANLLRGRTVDMHDVESALQKGLPLDSTTCGWHYVEGLTVNDDGNLALFWDNIGLGHNGERLSNAGHTVFFIGGYSRFVPDTEWPAFLQEQERMMKQRKAIGH